MVAVKINVMHKRSSHHRRQVGKSPLTLCAQGLAQQNDTTVGSAENRKTSHVKNRNTNSVHAFQISSIILLHLAGVILIVAPQATRSFRVGLPLPMTEVACSP